MSPLHVRGDGSFVVLLDRLPYHVALNDPLWLEAAKLDWSQAKPERAASEAITKENVVTVSKIDAAIEQLEWAIALIVDHGAFLPAVTLAGAAEEIFGKLSGRPILNEQAKSAEAARAGQGKWLIKLENEVRNWLKHHDTEKDEIWTMDFDPRVAAVFMVGRALANHSACGLPQPKNAHRYYVWLYEIGGAQRQMKMPNKQRSELRLPSMDGDEQD